MRSKDLDSVRLYFRWPLPRRVIRSCVDCRRPSRIISRSCRVLPWRPMQSAVEYDSKNRSNYTMCVVNSSCTSKIFHEVALREVAEIVGHCTDALLEIVDVRTALLIAYTVGLFPISGLSICRSRRPFRSAGSDQRSQLSQVQSHLNSEDVVFWKWVPDSIIGIVTDTAVYRNATDATPPAKIIDHHGTTTLHPFSPT